MFYRHHLLSDCRFGVYFLGEDFNVVLIKFFEGKYK